MNNFPTLEAIAAKGVLALALLSCLVLGLPAWAQDRVSFDFDDPPETNNPITDTLSYGGELEFDGLHTENLDLDSGRDDDQTLLEPLMALALTYEPNETFRAYVDMEFARLEALNTSPDGESDETSLSLIEAYFTLREFIDGTTLQIGRQEFKDELEWYFDQELDAARAYYRIGNVAVETSVSQQGLVEEDFLNGDDTDDVINAFLVGHYALAEESRANAYLLYRDGRERESEDLLFLGLQSYGELTDDLDYWFNAAYVTGEAKDEDGTRDVDGFGIDVVATYAPDVDWEPSLTLGFAFGSGDDNPGSGRDTNFRQTGLQENEATFNGETNFKYYGETFDPELSNLGIFTVGAGVKPSEATSIDLVYHYYWQHHASEEIRDSNLETDPDGRNRELGHGIDLVFGFLEIEDLSAEFVVGTFIPGQAFDNDADNAVFLGFEIQYEF